MVRGNTKVGRFNQPITASPPAESRVRGGGIPAADSILILRPAVSCFAIAENASCQCVVGVLSQDCMQSLVRGGSQASLQLFLSQIKQCAGLLLTVAPKPLLKLPLQVRLRSRFTGWCRMTSVFHRSSRSSRG